MVRRKLHINQRLDSATTCGEGVCYQWQVWQVSPKPGFDDICYTKLTTGRIVSPKA